MTRSQTLLRQTVALPRLTLRSLLARLVAADQAYRARHHLQSLTKDGLRDAGLLRDERGALHRT